MTDTPATYCTLNASAAIVSGRWRRRCRVAVQALALAAFAAMAACGGGSEPRVQPADPRSEQFTGQVILAGESTPATHATVQAKGATGLPRTTTPTADSTYAVSASGLAGPYLLVSGPMGAVTIGTGVVNLNELARLQSSLLLGRSPLDAFAGFGNGSPSIALITEENLAASRTRALAFLRDELGIGAPAGDASSFINAPFVAAAGDPVYDTLLALNRRMAELGPDAYFQRVDEAVAEARRCLDDKVILTAGNEVVEFCPARRRTTADTADASVLVYAFTNQAGSALTLRARDRTVLGVHYAARGGSAYACTGLACSGFGIGEAAPDRSRTITFASALLTGGGTAAVVDGALTAAAPGVVLPPLPCDDNRFFLVLPDTTVIADCVSNTVVDLGLTGTFGTQQGQTDYAVYPFTNTDGSNGLPASESPTRIQLILDGSRLISVTATRADPSSGALALDFKCRGEACGGVTIGPPVLNTDSGFNAQLRRITFEGTELAAVNVDGSLASGPPAILSGAFASVFIATAEFGGNPPTRAEDCSGFAEVVTYAPSNETNIYALCPERAGATAPSAEALPLDNGGLRISFPASPLPLAGEPPPPFDLLLITTDGAGAVTRATIDPTSSQGSSLGATFACANVCSGVSISVPDAAGDRTVTFTNAVLNLVEPDGQPTDTRTAVVNGRFIVPAARLVAGATVAPRSPAGP